MLQRLRNRQGGFTLIELLIVVAIIGIIAAILIPNLLDALQKSKQKVTMSDERTIGTAAFSWITDMVSASAAGRQATIPYTYPADSITFAQLEEILVSPTNLAQDYLQTLPITDGWGNAYQFNLQGGATATAGDLQSGGSIFAVQSAGRDGDAGVFESVAERETFIATDYDRDILWADGYFIQKPGGLGGS